MKCEALPTMSEPNAWTCPVDDCDEQFYEAAQLLIHIIGLHEIK